MPRAKIEKTAKTCNLLTPLEIKNAKLPEGKAETALNDGDGLYLIITENRKRWRYRYGLNGKMFKQWLGEYPKVTLAQARKLRNDSLSKGKEGKKGKKGKKGKDPRIEKQVAKIAAQYSIANTFAAYTEKYVLKS